MSHFLQVAKPDYEEEGNCQLTDLGNGNGSQLRGLFAKLNEHVCVGTETQLNLLGLPFLVFICKKIYFRDMKETIYHGINNVRKWSRYKQEINELKNGALKR